MEHGLRKVMNSYFGYKLHNKVDVEYGLIRTIETTTASVHDSQIDLSSVGERSTEIKAILEHQQEVIL
jgi:IS5 family transposase